MLVGAAVEGDDVGGREGDLGHVPGVEVMGKVIIADCILVRP